MTIDPAGYARARLDLDHRRRMISRGTGIPLKLMGDGPLERLALRAWLELEGGAQALELDRATPELIAYYRRVRHEHLVSADEALTVGDHRLAAEHERWAAEWATFVDWATP